VAFQSGPVRIVAPTHGRDARATTPSAQECAGGEAAPGTHLRTGIPELETAELESAFAFTGDSPVNSKGLTPIP